MMHTLHQSTGSRSCAATAAIAAALCLVGPAWAQDSTEPTQLKPTVVTGTYLESADAAGTLTVTPVELTAPINQGFSTVADVLRTKLPQYGGPGNINPSFGNGGDGNSYISLRGLPGNATLVLVNGRRTSLAALNLIPDAAVEKIEILNAGGCRFWFGAVAGVVNVHQRTPFRAPRSAPTGARPYRRPSAQSHWTGESQPPKGYFVISPNTRLRPRLSDPPLRTVRAGPLARAIQAQ